MNIEKWKCVPDMVKILNIITIIIITSIKKILKIDHFDRMCQLRTISGVYRELITSL